MARMNRSTRQILRLLPLALLLGFSLFPFGWLGERWPRFGIWLGQTFSGDWGHGIAHFGIFFVIGLTLLGMFPTLRSRLGIFLLIGLGLGIAQEGIQLIYKQRPLVWDELRDLVVDLIGMLAAYGGARVLNRGDHFRDPQDKDTQTHTQVPQSDPVTRP